MNARFSSGQSAASWGRRLGICVAAAAAGACLTGCPTLPGATAAAGANGPAGTDRDAPRGGAAPATTTAPAPTQRVNPATSITDKRAGESIDINPKKVRPLATFEGDLICKQMVAPFTLQENASILAELGMKGLFETVGGMFESWASGTSAKLASQEAANSVSHKIPYELRSAAVRMNWLPMEVEQLYGRTVLETMESTGKLEPKDTEAGRRLYPRAQALLNETLKGVEEAHDYKFEIYVSTESGQNALALPGGMIVIDPMLLNKPALAPKAQFAIAHEVAHVLQRHETRILQARIIDIVSMRSSLSDLAKVMAESRSNPKAIVTLVMAGKLQFERHYVSQELHSDGCAVQMLHRNLRDDTKLTNVLNSFIAALPPPKPESMVDASIDPPTGAGSNLPKTAAALQGVVDLVSRPIDRHPTTKERVDNLKAALKAVRDSAAPVRTQQSNPKAPPAPAKSGKT